MLVKNIPEIQSISGSSEAKLAVGKVQVRETWSALRVVSTSRVVWTNGDYEIESSIHANGL